MAFEISLSGLNASNQGIEVTSNNIANASTNGFKRSRIEFGDLYANTLSDARAVEVGKGVKVNRVAQQFNQGNIDFTQRNFDLAINGEGFFVLQNAAGDTEYTRAGAYSTDSNGFIVNHQGQFLQIYPATVTSTATTFNTTATSNLQLLTTTNPALATTSISTAINLDSTSVVPTVAFDPTNSASYNYSASTTIFDSLGNQHTATYYYTKQAAGTNQWQVNTYVDGADQSNSPNNIITFDSAGVLATPAAGTLTSSTFTPTGAASMTLTTDVSSLTQYGNQSSVNSLKQDGYASGQLSGVDVDKDGIIFARYTNGQSQALGKVALARFNSPQNLTKQGETNWAQSFSSGSPQLGEANLLSFGGIQSGALEASNVNMAEELVDLITSQRNFQANSKGISSLDQMLQTIIQV